MRPKGNIDLNLDEKRVEDNERMKFECVSARCVWSTHTVLVRLYERPKASLIATRRSFSSTLRSYSPWTDCAVPACKIGKRACVCRVVNGSSLSRSGFTAQKQLEMWSVVLAVIWFDLAFAVCAYVAKSDACILRNVHA